MMGIVPLVYFMLWKLNLLRLRWDVCDAANPEAHSRTSPGLDPAYCQEPQMQVDTLSSLGMMLNVSYILDFVLVICWGTYLLTMGARKSNRTDTDCH